MSSRCRWRAPVQALRLVLGVVLSSMSTGPLAAQRDARPNFVFIYADDQRWDALGVVQREQGDHARFPWLRTPNLDQLAREGVRFRNAFVVHSLCTPSRASFLTGRYTHEHGITGNFTPFSDTLVTHATVLRQAGYATGYVGKWHMGQGGGPRPGFDYSASYRGQGSYLDAVFEVEGKDVTTSGWVDDVATDYALDFIRKSRSQPFSLVIGYKTPHRPMLPPDRLRKAFLGERIASPTSAMDPPPYLGQVHPVCPSSIKRAGNNAVDDWTDYFRSIAAIDENVGRVLDELDRLGLTENTVVVYSSDNGYLLREHGIGDKRAAYEESIRVPMLVRYPKLGSKGRVVDDMVLNIDLAPTLIDLAGGKIPESMQGRSWRPLLAGESRGWRESFLYEYFFYPDISDYELQTADPPITPTMVAVRTRDAKLVTYPGHQGWTELFDLRRDPYERVNLAQDPTHAAFRQRMEAELELQKVATRFRIPAESKIPAECQGTDQASTGDSR